MSRVNITGTVVDAPLANTDVYITEFDDSAKVFYCESGANSAIFHVDAGAVVAVSAGAVFSDTKDTASKINVYVESNVIKIQNLTAGAVSPVYRTL